MYQKVERQRDTEAGSRDRPKKKKVSHAAFSTMSVLPTTGQIPALGVLILSAFVNNILPSGVYEVKKASTATQYSNV